MYPDIAQATQSFYEDGSSIFVVETYKGGPFQADMTISDYQDRAQAAYGLRYFVELKLSPKNVLTPENCGQVLDYFYKAHEFQPH